MARTNIAGISLYGGEVDRPSELYEFHICEVCRQVSYRELFAKIPSLPLALEIVFFQSLPRIHDHEVRIGTLTYLKTDSFAVFETLRFVTTER